MRKITRRSFLAASLAATAAGVLSGCDAALSASGFTVGISQLVQHDALDAATLGFRDQLSARAEEAGVEAVFDEQNASGETANCSTIANGFVAAGVDLIMANATGALQAAVSATGEIPILGTSVTEYGVALGIDNFDGLVGTNVSGCSDLAPLDEQAAMLTTIFPDAATVGLLYCSAEANSQYQVDVIQDYLEADGIVCTQYSFADTNDVTSVTQSACASSDVIYVPTDNTVASNTEAINNVCQPSGVPIIAGEESICGGCGVATLTISYYDLGVATGEMAARILIDGEDISTMPIEYAAEFTPKYNATLCEVFDITPPSDYVAIEA
ncbi:MAG: ABC transporter substrate-binding protein [Faecalibacterium sp.]